MFFVCITCHRGGGEGGDQRTLRLYKCSIVYTRYQCKALYTEPEYEELVVDAHHKCKRPWLSKDFNNGHRAPFFCMYCDDNFKDKNSLSWHRFRSVCANYKGTKLLKIYPTWGKSEISELKRLRSKFDIEEPEMPEDLKRASADEGHADDAPAKKQKVQPPEGHQQHHNP